MSSIKSSTNGISDVFYPLYKRLFSDDSERIATLRRDLARARIQTPAEVYMSRALGYGFLAGVFLWLIVTVAGYIAITAGIFNIGRIFNFNFPAHPIIVFIDQFTEFIVVGVAGLLFGALGVFLIIAPALFWPKLKSKGRQSEIEILLPDTISYMYALSLGGLNQMEIMKKVADADDTYGEVSREFRGIILETEYFESDYRSAIKRQIEVTPSSEFAQFLSDMLSILDSGGDMQSFLKDKQHKHTRLARQHQNQNLETLELLGEIYMTVSLFPLLLMIILVIMSMLGETVTTKLYGTVYGLIPAIGIAFLILLATVKQDEVGDGKLDHPTGAGSYQKTRLIGFPIVSKYASKAGLFSKAKTKEQTFQTRKILLKPHVFFREHPSYTLFLTVPASIVFIIVAVSSGVVPTTFEGFKEAHVWGTFVYLYMPVYISFFPLAVFGFWKNRQMGSITKNLSDTLRKLSSANDAGQPLLESIKTVTKSSSGRLSMELREIYSKVLYGARMKNSLIEFNNKYAVPRLARITKLITDAQETSEDITEVLSTAAETSENQDDIIREQKSKTRQQMVIIIMTYVILLGVMALLKLQFLDVMGELANQASGASEAGAAAGGGGSGPSFGANVDVQLLSMLFFHAVTLQAIISGFLGGYMRTNSIKSGIKFVLPLMTLAFGVWLYVA